MNTTNVDSYLAEGCGRCDRFQTPSCKVHAWGPVLVELRALLQGCGLAETLKWGQPTYTLDGSNVAMIAAREDSCAISFFKGVLLDDPDGVLEKPGPNSHVGRLLRFDDVEQVRAHRGAAEALVKQAMEVQRAGTPIPAREDEPEVPAELQDVLDGDPTVQAAFDALTPGRQRSYVFHVSGAKRAQTRARRAERCVPKILAGKGFNER